MLENDWVDCGVRKHVSTGAMVCILVWRETPPWCGTRSPINLSGHERCAIQCGESPETVSIFQLSGAPVALIGVSSCAVGGARSLQFAWLANTAPSS